MKRIAAFLVVMGGAALASGVAVEASAVPPTLTTPTATVAAGASFTETVTGCLNGEIAAGSFQSQTPTDTCEGGTAALSFAAPTAPGTYTGTIALSQSAATLTFTVTVAAAPTTTIATTTVAPPTTNPATGLPATGSDSGMTVTIAIVMLVAGVGLFVVANLRRRQNAAV